MGAAEPHPYYLERRPQIVADFTANFGQARSHFERLVPSLALEPLLESVLAELDRVLATLPYVGGASGRLTPFFEQSAGFFALGRVLRRQSVPLDITATLMRKAFLAKLAGMTREERYSLGRQWLSEESKAYLRTTAATSAEREHPGDFVYSFLEPGLNDDGEPYEFGLDYSECGFCKLCKANGDEELLPVMCAMDKEVYALRGIDLHRSTTLAGGAKQCNFRFRAMPELRSEG